MKEKWRRGKAAQWWCSHEPKSVHVDLPATITSNIPIHCTAASRQNNVKSKAPNYALIDTRIPPPPRFSLFHTSSSSVPQAQEEAEERGGFLQEKKRMMMELGSGENGAAAAAAAFRDGVEEEEMMRGRKRRKKKSTEDEPPLLQDPLEVLGRDIMMRIMSNLDALSLALSLVVSRGWHSLASSDRFWAPKCEELWLGKAHIPRLSQVRGISKLEAYSLSVMDGRRTRIMMDDLCDHTWEFHFTKAAPDYWRNLDPYWKGTGPLMHRYFHPDGSQTADPDDKVWGGHECCFCIVTGIIGETTIRRHYVRINRWLPLSIHRRQDWSWEMSNSLYCYSSVPDAYKEGGTGPLFLVIPNRYS